MCMFVYLCIDVYACNHNRKRGRNFEREQGRIYGKVWREEREERNDVIIISKIKEMEGTQIVSKIWKEWLLKQ